VAVYPWLVLAVLVAAAAVLRFHGLGQKSVWVDEAVSIEMARLDWYNFMRILWRHEANMALYTLSLRLWLPFGETEAWIRTLSVIFSLATIPAVYVLGKKLFDPRVGLMGAFLLTINAFHVRYAQEARSYSLYPLLCVLSCIYFLKFLQDPSPHNRRAHVLTSALAVYAHFFAGFVAVAQWLSLRLLDQENIQQLTKKNWRQFALSITPLVMFVATTGLGILRWIPRPGFSSLHINAILLTGAGGDKLLYLYLAACGVALLPVTPALFRRKRLPWEEWRYIFLAIWIFLPILAVFILSQWKPCFLARYFIFTLPALGLLAAAGIARMRFHLLMGAVLLVFAAWSLPSVYSYYRKDIDIAREDFRNATQYLLSQAQTDDVILFHQPIGRMSYEYYRSLTEAPAYPVVIYPEHGEQLTYKDFYAGRAPEPFLQEVSAKYRRVWVIFTYNQLPDGPDPTTRFITDTFGKSHQQIQRKTFTGIEVRLYANEVPQHKSP
jgi:uncharacterized membrane protein